MDNENQPLSVGEKIALLEEKQDEDLAELKYQLSETAESMRPVHLLKEAGSTLVRSGKFRKTVLIGVVGFALGYLLKRLIMGKPEPK